MNGIWILLAVWFYVDYKMFVTGYESSFFKCKTAEEKELRTAAIENARSDNVKRIKELEQEVAFWKSRATVDDDHICTLNAAMDGTCFICGKKNVSGNNREV